MILSECDIIGDPKPFPNNLPSNVIHSTQRAIPPMLKPTYSSLNEPQKGSVYNPETGTIKEKLEESVKVG